MSRFGENSLDEYAFYRRARSTFALRGLWASVTAEGRPLWLGMLEVMDRSKFRGLTLSERMAYVDEASAAATRLEGGRPFSCLRPWVDERMVFAMDAADIDEVRAVIRSLPQLCAGGHTRPFPAVAALHDPGRSVSDQIDRLALALGTRPAGEWLTGAVPVSEPGSPFAVQTSYSQAFLVDLVARNRREGRESVLREAVSLLLDSRPVDEFYPQSMNRMR